MNERFSGAIEDFSILETRIFRSLGTILIIIYVVSFPIKIPVYGIDGMMHFCDYATLATGISLVFLQPWLASVVLAQSLVAQSTWLMDFFAFAFTKSSITGDAQYMFSTNFPLSEYLLTLRHLAIVPLTAIFCLRTRYISTWWIHGLAAIITFFLIVLAVRWWGVNIALNVNCAFDSCWKDYQKQHTGLVYVSGYFFLTSSVVFATNAVIQLLQNRLVRHPKAAKALCLTIAAVTVFGLLRALWHRLTMS